MSPCVTRANVDTASAHERRAANQLTTSDVRTVYNTKRCELLGVKRVDETARTVTRAGKLGHPKASACSDLES
jgi:hypothetical protein